MVLATRVEQILTEAAQDVESACGALSLPGVVCAACVSALPVTGAGLVLMSEHGLAGLVGATDVRATVLEELQFNLGEGPCIDASTMGRPVLQPQLRATGTPRWPAFGRDAVDAGVEAIFAFPLQVGRIRLGVLDLYRDTPGTLGAAALREALCFADASLRMLLHLQDQQPLDGQLHPDLASVNSRLAVHQATGMIAVQARVGIADALLLLRARAYCDTRSLAVSAEEVITGTLRFTPVMAGER